MPRSLYGGSEVSWTERAERVTREVTRRLQAQTQAAAVDPASILTPGAFFPGTYGAKADGVTNDGPAIRACLVAARAWAGSNVEESTPRIPRVDFGGLVYATDVQIEIPGGQGMLLENGSLVAGAGFSSGLYLMRLGDAADPAMADGFRNVNTTIRNLYFDNKHVGGGLLLERFMRCAVERCLFAHYETEGLRTSNTGSHELFLTTSQFGEYWWGETDGVGYNHADLFVGTGVSIDSSDNHVTDCVIQLSKIGMRVSRPANTFSQIHIWTGYVKDPANGEGPTGSFLYFSTGLWITDGGYFCSFDQMYMDGCEVLWETPWRTSFTNSIFVSGHGDPNRAFIRFKPMAPGMFASGVVITGNSFSVLNNGELRMISTDTSVGTFNAGQVTNCAIENNSFSGVSDRKFTTIKAAFSSNATHTWTFDFSGLLAFGDVIQLVQATAYSFSNQTTIVRVANFANAVVTVSSYDPLNPANLQSINGTVWLEVSVNQHDMVVPVATLP